jgi:hypothetical protein
VVSAFKSKRDEESLMPAQNHIARQGPRRPRKAPKSDGCVDGRMYRTVSDVVEDLKMTLKILNNTASFRTQENAPGAKSFLLPFFNLKLT